MGSLKECLQQAGLENAFKAIEDDDFLSILEEAELYDALANDSLYLLLQSLVVPGTLPATNDKLTHLGWPDEDQAKLIDVGALEEVNVALIYAITAGALSLAEYNDYATAANQELPVLVYSDKVATFLSWLQERSTVPKIDHTAFGG